MRPREAPPSDSTPRPAEAVLRAAAGPSVETAQRPPARVADLLGTSPAVAALRRTVAGLARSEAATILLQGESGTGKELVARALHGESPRAAREFVALNCSAVPDALLEAELYGYEPGAFTDARRRKRGLVEVARGGTLFLDEVGELPLALQAKLLRLLEDRSFRPLGGTDEVEVDDVRFVAATNVDLARAVHSGRFRADLYYRLNVVAITIPPLRERREDVPLLARDLLQRFARRFHKSFDGFEPEALERLAAHDWPGNVRELRNAIERVVLLEEGPLVRADALVLAPPQVEGGAAPTTAPRSRAEGREEDLDLERLELRALVRALELARGNLSAAARRLGVSRDAVRLRMRRFGVRVETVVVVDRPPTGPEAG